MSPSQADRLRAKIEHDILSFNWKPGERLDESKLAEKYGTSRTPVREALRQLSSNGLVEIRPHKGAIVAKLGLRELVELLEVMAELEGACGRLAAKACLKSDLDAIREAHNAGHQLVETNDTEGYKKANENFHETIYRASRNSHLYKLVIGVRNRVAAYRRLRLDHVARLSQSHAEHEQIVDAIERGQPSEADRLLQEHVLTLGSEMRRLISAFSEDDLEHLAYGASGKEPACSILVMQAEIRRTVPSEAFKLFPKNIAGRGVRERPAKASTETLSRRHNLQGACGYSGLEIIANP